MRLDRSIRTTSPRLTRCLPDAQHLRLYTRPYADDGFCKNDGICLPGQTRDLQFLQKSMSHRNVGSIVICNRTVTPRFLSCPLCTTEKAIRGILPALVLIRRSG